MSRGIKKHRLGSAMPHSFFPLLILSILGLCLSPIGAESSGFELGLRTGIGYRVPGRLDGNLNGFSSTFNPSIPNSTSLSSANQTGTIEFVAKAILSSQSKIGVYLGRQDLAPIQLTEVTGDLFFTNLNSDIFSYHALFGYFFVFPLGKNLEWENGIAMGPSIADWLISGNSGSFGSSRNLIPQVGDLRGLGLAMRAETSLQQRILDSTFLQISLGYHFISISQFSGSYNGERSSFYIREDGRVGVLDETRVTDASLQTNQFLRRFDMNTGAWNLYFSVLQRFSD